jgi:hypothetical protein
VVKHDDGPRARGSKLATWRTRLDRAGRLPPMALAALQGHDSAWCRPVLEEAPVWRAGERLLAERGCSDGATLSALQRQRQVEGIMPLKATRLATREALQLAEMAAPGPPHPARAGQTLALGRGVEPRWTECAVPLHACVMRFWHKKKKCTDPLVLLTTDLQLRAPWIVRHSAERPEIAPDDAQRKSGGWQLQKLSATR